MVVFILSHLISNRVFIKINQIIAKSMFKPAGLKSGNSI